MSLINKKFEIHYNALLLNKPIPNIVSRCNRQPAIFSNYETRFSKLEQTSFILVIVRHVVEIRRQVGDVQMSADCRVPRRMSSSRGGVESH